MKPLPQDRFIDVGAIRTRYWDEGSRDEGSAPGRSTVLLLHGIGCSVLEWERNLTALAARHRVYALDLLGFGLTDKPAAADYSIGGHVRFILDFMSEMGVSSAHLAGNSLGGLLALACARDAPQRVRSMLLAAPAGVEVKHTAYEFRLATVPFLGELATRPNALGTRMLWRKAFYAPDAFVSDDLVATKVRLASQPGAQTAFLKTLRDFSDAGGFAPQQVAQLHKQMPQLRTPTLAIFGRDDRLIPASHGEALRQRLPDVDVQVWERCGHMPQVECAPRFNEAALAFWQRVDAGTPL